MDIKARVCKDENSHCDCCLQTRDKVLDIFEIRIPLGGKYRNFKLCDECVDKLFVKTLRCTCYTNGRVKSRHEINISGRRKENKYIKEHGEQEHIPINPPPVPKKKANKEKDEWDKIIEEYGE